MSSRIFAFYLGMGLFPVPWQKVDDCCVSKKNKKIAQRFMKEPFSKLAAVGQIQPIQSTSDREALLAYKKYNPDVHVKQNNFVTKYVRAYLKDNSVQVLISEEELLAAAIPALNTIVLSPELFSYPITTIIRDRRVPRSVKNRFHYILNHEYGHIKLYRMMESDALYERVRADKACCKLEEWCADSNIPEDKQVIQGGIDFFKNRRLSWYGISFICTYHLTRVLEHPPCYQRYQYYKNRMADLCKKVPKKRDKR